MCSEHTRFCVWRWPTVCAATTDKFLYSEPRPRFPALRSPPRTVSFRSTRPWTCQFAPPVEHQAHKLAAILDLPCFDQRMASFAVGTNVKAGWHHAAATFSDSTVSKIFTDAGRQCAGAAGQLV